MLLSLGLSWKLSPQSRVLAGSLCGVAVLCVFLIAGRSAENTVRALYAKHFSEESVVDTALWPMPGDPACWAAVVVSRGSRDRMILRRAMLAPFPTVLSAANCPSYRLPTTAPLVEVVAEADERVAWGKQLSVSIESWNSLARRCDVRAYLQFSRAPFFILQGDTILLGDLRFDRTDRRDFAEAEFPATPGPCPSWLPAWEPPRADLLSL